jgi:hypothetical protein
MQPQEQLRRVVRPALIPLFPYSTEDDFPGLDGGASIGEGCVRERHRRFGKRQAGHQRMSFSPAPIGADASRKGRMPGGIAGEARIVAQRCDTSGITGGPMLHERRKNRSMGRT